MNPRISSVNDTYPQFPDNEPVWSLDGHVVGNLVVSGETGVAVVYTCSLRRLDHLRRRHRTCKHCPDDDYHDSCSSHPMNGLILISQRVNECRDVSINIYLLR